MADSEGYENKWSQWADKEFTIELPFDISLFTGGYALHLVYADRPHDDPIGKYSLNTETNYLKKLVTKSSSAALSEVTMYGQRETSALFEIGKNIDVIFMLQVADANYNTNKQPFGDPAPFCIATKGNKTELPDIGP
jgi:hypothetical protein